MQERIKALESVVEKYIRLVKELKLENSEFKAKLKHMELENQALLKSRAGDSDAKKIKIFMLKRLAKINEKLDKEIRNRQKA